MGGPERWLETLEAMGEPSLSASNLTKRAVNSLLISGMAAILRSLIHTNERLNTMAQNLTDLTNVVGLLKTQVADAVTQVNTAVGFIADIRTQLQNSGVLSAEQQQQLDAAIADIGTVTAALGAATTALDAADDPTPNPTPTPTADPTA